MCNKGWLKRMLPFLATFAVGVFIASFFVSVGPGFGFSERRMRRFQEMQRLRVENDQLRQENLQLRNQFNKNWDSPAALDDKELLGPDSAVPPPPPLPAPRAHK